MKPAPAKLKFYLSLFAMAGCLLMPFVTAILLRLYGINENDGSFETFQLLKNKLIPVRTLWLNIVFVMCLSVLCWNIIDYWKYRRLGLFDVVMFVLMLVAVLCFVLIRTVIPARVF